MNTNKLLGVTIDNLSKSDILEKIKKYILEHKEFVHVMSLNPENLVLAHERADFMRVVNSAQIRIADGAGVVVAGRVLGVPVGGRLTGVELMETLLKQPDTGSLRVMLIGGKGNLADEIVIRQLQSQPQAKIFGLEGIKNIKNPTSQEERKIFSIVAATRPHLVFVSFGSPFQELWIHKNRHKFGPAVVAGVGGAFDMIGGRVARAPKLLRTIGMEWLFRLLRQPWRAKRQLRLLKFAWLVLAAKMKLSS